MEQEASLQESIKTVQEQAQQQLVDMNSQLKTKVSISTGLLHHTLKMMSSSQSEELLNMEKSSAERQLELQNELASLQMSNENLTTEVSRKEHQLTEVTFMTSYYALNKQSNDWVVVCVCVCVCVCVVE